MAKAEVKEIPRDAWEKILEALEAAGVDRDCPRCGNEEFTLSPYYSGAMVQNDKHDVLIYASIPTITTICNKCGFLSHHVLSVLGMPIPDKAEASKPESPDGKEKS